MAEIIKLELPFMELLEHDDNVCIVQVDLLHEGLNRNNTHISHECVLASLPSFFNKYLIYRLDGGEFSGVSDFEEHNRSGYDTSMNIAGHIPESSTVEFVEIDGKTYLRMTATISSLYQPLVCSILKKRGGNVKVSIELQPLVAKKGENGALVLEKFKFLGVCLLGETRVAGIEGSNLEVCKYSLEMENEKYLKYTSNYEIPASVRENAVNGLELRKSEGRGGNSMALAMGKFLSKNQTLTYDRLKKISEYFERNGNVEETHPITNEYITSQLYGGDMSWVKGVVKTFNGSRKGVIMNSIGVRELENKLWSGLKHYVYHDGTYTGQRYWIQEIYPSELYIIVKDNQVNKFYKMKYTVSKSGDVDLAEHNRTEVSYRFEERPETIKNAILFVSEDIGTGDVVKVDKSSSAMSTSKWGSVDKSDLRKRILSAKNYKALVKDTYLVVEDGWETAPSEKLKYPVMCFEGGKLVYNREGLASALGYAKKEKDTAAVKKAERLYDELNIAGGKTLKNKLTKNKLDADNRDIDDIEDDMDVEEHDDDDDGDDRIVDEPANKRLDDDMRSDKDYWEKKHKAYVKKMALKCSILEEKLNKFEMEATENSKKEAISKYGHLFTETELTELEKNSKSEVDEKVAKKALEFVAKKHEPKEDVVKNNFGNKVEFFSLNKNMNNNTDKARSIDDVINDYSGR